MFPVAFLALSLRFAKKYSIVLRKCLLSACRNLGVTGSYLPTIKLLPRSSIFRTQNKAAQRTKEPRCLPPVGPCGWLWRTLTFFCSFTAKKGLSPPPTLYSSVSSVGATPVLGEHHVISKTILLSGVQMGYDGLENLLFCLKATEFP